MPVHPMAYSAPLPKDLRGRYLRNQVKAEARKWNVYRQCPRTISRISLSFRCIGGLTIEWFRQIALQTGIAWGVIGVLGHHGAPSKFASSPRRPGRTAQRSTEPREPQACRPIRPRQTPRAGENHPPALSYVERETGFEPAILGLGSRCCTTQLLPLEASWTVVHGRITAESAPCVS